MVFVQVGFRREAEVVSKARSRGRTATLGVGALLAQLTAFANVAAACGMMLVATQATKLVSSNSKVVIALDQNPEAPGEAAKIALTIAVDYHGAPKEFAAVIPVPTFIERRQIGIVDMKAIDRIDSLTAPALVEANDPDPCRGELLGARAAAPAAAPGARTPGPHQAVTVEANYDVGEYDISILAATESKGLLNWLNEHGYKLPAGAEPVLASYLGEGMRFFVAKVNLERMPLVAGQFLHPLQVRYETAKPMLPIRLGMVNANGPQDLTIFVLSRSGPIEVANYKTVEMPTGIDVPRYVKGDFGRFYNAVFNRAVAQDMASVYLEHAWPYYSGAPERTDAHFVDLGARWLAGDIGNERNSSSGGLFLTRLHVRYDAAHFQEDLKFAENTRRDWFSAVYFLRHEWNGNSNCPAAEAYRSSLPARNRQRVSDLARLTGWPEAEIRAHMAATGEPLPDTRDPFK